MSSSLYSVLVLTAATLSHAQKFDFNAFVNLETNEVEDPLDLGHQEPEVDDFNREHHSSHEVFNEVEDPLDLGHQEPEVDDFYREHHSAHDKEMDENVLEWEIMEKVRGNLECKEGYTKVGCCKCVHDDHKAAKAEPLVDVSAMKSNPYKYHGMEPEQQAPAATAASPPNLAGWFSGSSDDEKSDDKKKKQQDKDDDDQRDEKSRS